MSLLLEALKRAEEDSKKRKLAAAEAHVMAPAFVNSSVKLSFSDSGDSDLSLLEIKPAQEKKGTSALSQPLDFSLEDAIDINFDSPELSTTQATPIEPTFKAAAPIGLTPAMASTSPRQAKSAANAMSGMPKAKSKPAPQKRVTVLAVAAVLIALPVAAFLLFGDMLLGSSVTTVASTPPPALAAAPPGIPAAAALPAEPVAVTASVTLASPTPTTMPAQAEPARNSAMTTRQRGTDNPPAPRTRTTVTSRTAQGEVATRSTVIDLDRPASNARAASPMQQPTRRPATTMEAAYAAFQSGNSAEATRLYKDVLKQDPTQRDAWLGLAVIAHNNNQLEAAMDAYKRVLRLEPQNATALAGLTALNNNADEPRQESRLRELLARSPQEADLNHSLALVLSGERRWSEAQQLFFKAHTLAPQEPQFAYNLAVALDQLRRPTLAAQYYETALNLAQGKAPSFDETRARSRLAALRAGNPDTKTP